MQFHHACMRTHDQTIALHTHLWRRAMRYSEAGRGKESKGGRDLLNFGKTNNPKPNSQDENGMAFHSCNKDSCSHSWTCSYFCSRFSCSAACWRRSHLMCSA